MDIRTFNKTLPKMIIPLAEVKWAHLHKEHVIKRKDGTTTPTNKKDITVVLDPEHNQDHAAFMERLHDIVDKGLEMLPAKKRSKAYLPTADEENEDGEPTGRILVKANTNAKNRDGQETFVTIVDAKKRPVTKEVYGGSKVKVAVKPSVYDTGSASGVKLYLNAVQVLELVAGGGAASDFDIEEGYEDDGVPQQSKEVDVVEDDEEF